MNATAFIGVGANIEPEKNIARALDLLKERVRVTGVSTFYRTVALKRPAQPSFLNGAFRIDTELPPRALKFEVLRPVEAVLGRVRGEDPWTAREIDLDIVLYGEVVLDMPDLRIPDPEVRRRPFLAAPVLELGPDLTLPDTGEPLADIVSDMDFTDVIPVHDFTKNLRARLTQ